MDLRDRFALEIVKAMLAAEKTAGDTVPEDAAHDAYLFADALMAARGECPAPPAAETDVTADIESIMGRDIGEAGA